MDVPSTKPYLVRALYEWCTDSGFTPFISVCPDDRARVPREHVRDGQITLNIGQEATGNLLIANEAISFQARFGGVVRDIYVPMENVAAIYARENGVGFPFETERLPLPLGTEAPPEAPAAGVSKRSHLQRIK